MNKWLVTYGQVKFDIDELTNKHKNQSSWKSHVITFINDDLDSYYRWFLKRKYNFDLIRPIRGPHLTIVNDRTEEISNWDQVKKEYNNKTIKIYYNIDLRSNAKHWWLKAYSCEADIIRNKLGLGDPFYNPHITIGLTNWRNQEASDYAIRCEKRFGSFYQIDYSQLKKECI